MSSLEAERAEARVVQESSSVSAALVLGASLVVTLAYVAAAAWATLHHADVEAMVRGGLDGADFAAAAHGVSIASTLSNIGLVAVLVAWLATAGWLANLRAVADRVAPHYPHRRSSWWPLAAWVVPILNLWLPYQLVADTSRALGSRVTNFWPWWIAWLVASSGSGIVALNQDNNVWDSGDVDGWALGLQVNAVVMVVAFVLWWRVVRAATDAARAASPMA